MMCGKTSMKAIARFAKAHRNELAKYIPLPRQQTMEKASQAQLQILTPTNKNLHRLSHFLAK
jgi:hypothetical protein